MSTRSILELTADTPDDELAERARAAATAFAAWSQSDPSSRARALVGVADALAGAADELVEIAIRETGLGELRLRGELKRTSVQLRLFADVVVDGAYLDVRLDGADPEFALGPRPDLRRVLVPRGPVLNFAASNFPFAFSVAGGDTASALAAGCSVIVKAHWGHPELSWRTAQLVSEALALAGAPSETLQVIFGQDQGVAMLRDEHVRVGVFTGSLHAGRLLADVAAARPDPIPFYGELGSVNPQFVTRAKLDRDGDALIEGYLASVSSSAGQFCTKPGFLFVPDAAAVVDAVRVAASRVDEHRMLNPRIAASYDQRRDEILTTDGVRVLAEGSVRYDDDGHGWVTPTIVAVDVDVLVGAGRRLLDEAFGPLSIVVDYGDESRLAGLARQLFPGNLTGGVHAGDDEATPALSALIEELHHSSGRVLWNGWPTGVAVTPAMQHGGPWPATTNDAGTSVGTAAIGRFLRGVSYQNVPAQLLPAALRDDNPWRVPQRRAPAGESSRWGRLE